jgi:hypothetical protein
MKKSLAFGDEARIVALMDEDVTDEAAVPKAAQPRPLVGLPSSKPSQENSAPAAP